MKNMKKLLALVLAIMMVMSLAITAFAAEGEEGGEGETVNNSITIANAKVGETYEIYKMLDLVVDDESDPKAYTYTVNSDWAAFFAEGGAGYQYVTINEAGAVSINETNDSDNMIAFAKAAEAWATEAIRVDKITATEGNAVVFENLENGYYLITSTLGTKAMIETTPDKEAVSVNEKNPVDSIEKEVKEDSTGAFGKENDAQVGDTVEFKTTVTLQPHTTNVKVHDTMDSGLTYENDVKVYTDEARTQELAAASYVVQTTPDEGDTFTIQFTEEYLATLTAETKLYLKYTAVLNEGAVVKDENGVAIVDQNNKTSVTYGNSQSVDSETKTTTHKSTVNKYADEVENLAGAVFKLWKGVEPEKEGDPAQVLVMLIKIDDENYRVAKAEEADAQETFVTVDTGDIVIWGLDTDTDYFLEEVTAPDGYNILTAQENLPVNAEDTGIASIENKSGTELPTTGGMGTTLFYIVGGMMVLAATVLLVTKKRMIAE